MQFLTDGSAVLTKDEVELIQRMEVETAACVEWIDWSNDEGLALLDLFVGQGATASARASNFKDTNNE